MACFETFSYQTLYQRVRTLGLPEKVQSIFSKYGQTNFEAVLKLLDESSWMAENYGLYPTGGVSEMMIDYECLKKSLTQAITEVHPEHRAMIPNEKYVACSAFISPFDEIFSVNYDLLLYWTSLHQEPFKFEDQFSKDEDTDGNDCEYMPHRDFGASMIYFLHGALHLYVDGNNVRKRVWKETNIPLVDQIRRALENKQYPLVVAEGDAQSKLSQIQASSYLSNCLRKFHRIEGHLFTFGHSLSDQDQHLIDIIAKNSALRHLWVGIRGDFTKDSNRRILEVTASMKQQRIDHMGGHTPRGKKGDLSVHFYNAVTAQVWGKERAEA